MVQTAGVGVRLHQFQKVTVSDLSAALTKCATNEALQARCSELSQILHNEDGLGATAREIESFLTDQVTTGKWRRQHEARRRHHNNLANRGASGLLRFISRWFCGAQPF